MLRLPVGILIGLFNNKAVVESRFRPQCAAYTEYLLVFVVEQNLVGMMQLTCSSCPLASYKKWPHCVKKWSRPQNRKHIRYIATPSGEGQATATVDMHKNLDSRVVPEISLHTNRQTHMHAHCNTSHPLPGGNETWHSTKHEECDLKFSNKPYCTARVLLARINSLTTTRLPFCQSRSWTHFAYKGSFGCTDQGHRSLWDGGHVPQYLCRGTSIVMSPPIF